MSKSLEPFLVGERDRDRERAWENPTDGGDRVKDGERDRDRDSDREKRTDGAEIVNEGDENLLSDERDRDLETLTVDTDRRPRTDGLRDRDLDTITVDTDGSLWRTDGLRDREFDPGVKRLELDGVKLIARDPDLERETERREGVREARRS